MKMNNPIPQPSRALRIEAVSINCILQKSINSAANGNLLIIAESLPAHYVEYLLLLRLIIIIHLIRRNAQSITRITDGRGNVISGGNNGGKSHISYTPYGSIHRTDSSGPDITRFKFTGQEEDKESGLLYYKARYYGRRRWVCDQANGGKMLGRFLQADSVVMPESTFGMNRYMYVNGSPMNFRDDTGNSCTGNYMSIVVGSIGFAAGSYYGGPAGGVAGFSASVGAFAVAPGFNWTGGGFSGRCGKAPNAVAALNVIFNKEGDSVKGQLIQLYVNVQQAKGETTFLDGLNTNRKAYTGLLIGLVLTNQLTAEDAFWVFNYMTNGVKEPTNKVDEASYNHDNSYGSNALGTSGNDPRTANKRWIKSAWAGVGTDPYKAFVALTGTVLFTTANAIYDIGRINSINDIKPFKKGQGPCAKGCRF